MSFINLVLAILALVLLGLAAQVSGVDTREEPGDEYERSPRNGGHRS